MAEEESFPGVDYNQIEGLQRKRLLKFINHFVLQTSHFLSNFSQTCDMKILNLAKKIQNIETSLSLLEMKLDSVPELKSIRFIQTELEVVVQKETPNEIEMEGKFHIKKYFISFHFTKKNFPIFIFHEKKINFTVRIFLSFHFMKKIQSPFNF